MTRHEQIADAERALTFARSRSDELKTRLGQQIASGNGIDEKTARKQLAEESSAVDFAEVRLSGLRLAAERELQRIPEIKKSLPAADKAEKSAGERKQSALETLKRLTREIEDAQRELIESERAHDVAFFAYSKLVREAAELRELHPDAFPEVQR